MTLSSTTTSLIRMALTEDIGHGDVTSQAIFAARAKGKAVIRAKQSLVLAGLDIAQAVFQELDPSLTWTKVSADGDRKQTGETLATIEGPVIALLQGERTCLNFLQHLSGIATLTARFVDAVQGTKAKILDTRKTLPGYRELEKVAVRMGGGSNHRIGLYDRYLIKNNHIAAAGGILPAIECIKAHQLPDLLLEVEARTPEEVSLAASAGVDIILLDNMTTDQIRTAVQIVAGRCKLEASGNMSLENVRNYAETGVNFISVGAITHSAPAADIHMTID
ncbi:MAG: carboxylating nicotinate-nucleotide diphosphorylase [Deltaproteobacteria bacterium]|nr:carboxylating nicotinate-nucleotide diphosphorylase [Deltaproteobacteria bacterium]